MSKRFISDEIVIVNAESVIGNKKTTRKDFPAIAGSGQKVSRERRAAACSFFASRTDNSSVWLGAKTNVRPKLSDPHSIFAQGFRRGSACRNLRVTGRKLARPSRQGVYR
jgi:hypothetical protein